MLREDDHGAGETERDLPAVLHLHEDPAEPEGRQVMPASDWSILVILSRIKHSDFSGQGELEGGRNWENTEHAIEDIQLPQLF